MMTKILIPVFACLTIYTLRANDLAIQQDQAPFPTKEEIVAALSVDDFNPRSLQILANAFYWSYEFKKAGIAALQTSKKNALLASNILLTTHNQEFASDERVLKAMIEFHKTWQYAHEMQRAQNACVGILSFKQDINEVANIILTTICTDSLSVLANKKQSVLAYAQKLNQFAQDSNCTAILEEFYTAVDSHDINTVYPALRNTKKNIIDSTRIHLSAAHALNTINTDIVETIETHFAQALFDWYQIVYTIMSNRGLLDTQYGMIMCDQNGLIEVDQRTQLLPKPEILTKA
jgi:hypothetical protein